MSSAPRWIRSLSLVISLAVFGRAAGQEGTSFVRREVQPPPQARAAVTVDALGTSSAFGAEPASISGDAGVPPDSDLSVGGPRDDSRLSLLSEQPDSMPPIDPDLERLIPSDDELAALEPSSAASADGLLSNSSGPGSVAELSADIDEYNGKHHHHKHGHHHHGHHHKHHGHKKHAGGDAEEKKVDKELKKEETKEKKEEKDIEKTEKAGKKRKAHEQTKKADGEAAKEEKKVDKAAKEEKKLEKEVKKEEAKEKKEETALEGNHHKHHEHGHHKKHGHGHHKKHAHGHKAEMLTTQALEGDEKLAMGGGEELVKAASGGVISPVVGMAAA